MLDQIFQMFLGNEIQEKFPGQKPRFKDADPCGNESPAWVIFYLRYHNLLFLKQPFSDNRERVIFNLSEDGVQCLVHLEIGAYKDETTTFRERGTP